MWIPACHCWPNTSPVPVNIQTCWVTPSEDSSLFFIWMVFFSLCLHLKINMLLILYTPGRCVLYGTGSQDSGPSQRTSPGRKSTACHHFSQRCLGWVVHGWKWDLWREEMVRCWGDRRIWENIWLKCLINAHYFLFITLWMTINMQDLYISAFGTLFGLHIEESRKKN